MKTSEPLILLKYSSLISKVMKKSQPKYNQNLSKLSNQKLISLALSSNCNTDYPTKTITALLKDCGDSLTEFVSRNADEISEPASIKQADFLRLKASLEIAARCRMEAQVDSIVIKRSSSVYQLFRHLEGLKYEEFWVVILNTANRLLRQIKISEGGISATVVDQKKIFKNVIDSWGSGIILVHNHPSENDKPSENDIKITGKILGAAKLFDIKVLDHLIITNGNYFSFADNSMI